MPIDNTPWRAYLCLAGSMALVGSYVGLSKLLVAVFPVLLLAWLRFGIGAVAMLHWLRRAPGEAPLTRRDRWLLFWESFLGNFLFSICMLYGLMLTSALAAGGGAPAGGNKAAEDAANAATAAAKSAAAAETLAKPAILSVEVLGFGEKNCKENQRDCFAK